MDSTTSVGQITEWLNQQVDPAFEPLLAKIAGSGTPVRWERGDFARTIRMQLGGREIAYTICIDPNSDPVTGQVQFKTPETECCKLFTPALDGAARSPGEMTGSDLVNDLIDQYGQRLRHILHRDQAARE